MPHRLLFLPFRCLCIVLILPSAALAADFTGRVVGVSDGDTITILHNGQGERIRLHGIDCPEKRQAFGKRAKQFTSHLVFAKTVTVQGVDRDRYGRTVGVVLLPDAYYELSFPISIGYHRGKAVLWQSSL